MPLYLSKFSYTPETWSRLTRNPEDRRKAAQAYIESVGGKLQRLAEIIELAKPADKAGLSVRDWASITAMTSRCRRPRWCWLPLPV
ncbi:MULTISPECIES: hypothetical protein [unclassified Pseudarthrobacter]|uniref:hypothetical protein n=1 Tax=unclassified Pseudarthrobacter TaxID=2647000 RepID=UPI00363F14B1